MKPKRTVYDLMDILVLQGLRDDLGSIKILAFSTVQRFFLGIRSVKVFLFWGLWPSIPATLNQEVSISRTRPVCMPFGLNIWRRVVCVVTLHVTV